MERLRLEASRTKQKGSGIRALFESYSGVIKFFAAIVFFSTLLAMLYILITGDIFVKILEVFNKGSG